jgi:flagellar assembly factor FliW
VKLQTAQLGEIEIKEEQVIQFPHGIPGFDHLRQFALLHPDELAPFSIMQSIEDEEICFIITDPFLYRKDYEFDLSESVLEELQIESENEVLVMAIVTIPGKIEDATFNLQAPVVVNRAKRIGKQVILHDRPYISKHRLFVSDQE